MPSPGRRLGALTTLVAVALTACGTSAAPDASPSPSASPPTTSAGAPTASPTSAPAITPHVMIIVLENQEYGDVIGNTGDAPYLNQLAQRYGLATNYHARTHPSLPNYIDLISGSTLNITSDCTDCSVEGDSLVDQLAKKGIGWTAYMEGMPSSCYQGADYPPGTQDGYAKKHDPFMYFDHLRAEPTACQNIVPYGNLASDLAAGRATPFVWISPTLCDDGHNTSCGLPSGDRWLSTNLPPILASSWYQAGGVIILTWDEGTSDESCCGGGAHGGHIATLVVSAATPAGSRLDTPVDHAGTLRTVEALYGLDYLQTASDPQSGDLMPLLGRPALH